MNGLDKVFNFIIEIEKLKGVLRKTRPVGFERYENSAEHSWHVCLAALMLKDFSNRAINIDRVIKMLLIHDLGEIDAGDTIIYASGTKEVKIREEAGIKRILGILPQAMAEEFFYLWQEFESGETPESIFARSIDRIPPLLHNLYGNGHSWKDNNISAEQVFAVNSCIAEGSETLWQKLKQELELAEVKGLIK